MSLYPSGASRRTYVVVDDGLGGRERLPSRPADVPQLVSSLCTDGFHRPALDVDLPIEVVPSSTAGHFHLYIDHPMTAEAYWKLVEALAEAGIVEEGYLAASQARGETMLRTPGTSRTDVELDRGVYPPREPVRDWLADADFFDHYDGDWSARG